MACSSKTLQSYAECSLSEFALDVPKVFPALTICLLLREQGSLPWKAVIKPTFESSSRDVDLQSYRTGAVLDVFLYFFSIQRSRTNTELYLQLFSIQVFSSICITRKKQHLLSQVSASNKACRARGYCKSFCHCSHLVFSMKFNLHFSF